MENVQYSTWAELFKIHARSHKVIHHIIPPEKGKEKVPSTDEEKELWTTLDSMVLQWIYATISDDLLNTIIEPDTMAMEAWNRLKDIFQDDKNSRAVALEQEFSHVNMEDFTIASAYCLHLKTLADELHNIGASVSNNRLVLQTVSSLMDSYHNVATLIRQSDPLPPFYKARSMLTLEEARFAKKAATSSGAALVVRDLDEDNHPRNNNNNNHGAGQGKNRQNSHRKRRREACRWW